MYSGREMTTGIETGGRGLPGTLGLWKAGAGRQFEQPEIVKETLGKDWMIGWDVSWKVRALAYAPHQIGDDINMNDAREKHPATEADIEAMKSVSPGTFWDHRLLLNGRLDRKLAFHKNLQAYSYAGGLLGAGALLRFGPTLEEGFRVGDYEMSRPGYTPYFLLAGALQAGLAFKNGLILEAQAGASGAPYPSDITDVGGARISESTADLDLTLKVGWKF